MTASGGAAVPDGEPRPTGPDDLLARIDVLVRQIDAEQAVPGASGPAGLDAVVSPVHAMRAAHATVHPPVDLGGRGSLVKRAVRRLTAWYVEPRWAAEQELDARTIEFASEVYNTLHRLEVELDDLRLQNARARLAVVAANERLRRVEQVADRALAAMAGAASEEEVTLLGKELRSLLDRLGSVSVGAADLDYVEFERRFRGDTEAITEAQRRYLSLFPDPEVPGTVLDIGCGTGEMLTLLTGAGHTCTGIDLDIGMVAACRVKGLDAVQDDALHYLAQTPAGSLKGIFCAQVVEHLLTAEVEELVRLAHRALADDGALVIETINPRSLYALGNHFYADTSHVRPVHPETLRFVCEQMGFRRVAVEERSPHPALALCDDLPATPEGDAVRALLESVFGYQDFVVVANR